MCSVLRQPPVDLLISSQNQLIVFRYSKASCSDPVRYSAPCDLYGLLAAALRDHHDGLSAFPRCPTHCGFSGSFLLSAVWQLMPASHHWGHRAHYQLCGRNMKRSFWRVLNKILLINRKLRHWHGPKESSGFTWKSTILIAQLTPF